MASGFGVLDFSMSKKLRRSVDIIASIDNLTNKRYYETQNYFESQLTSSAPVVSRIHATPGYPIGVSAGLRFHFGGK